MQKILSEKKLEQLKRAKERRLKEEQLRLDNEIAEAEDVVELAKTKAQFYEELEDAFQSPVSRTNSVQDITCEDKPKDVETGCSQNISETQKMPLLLQFLDCQPRSAVAGFEGLPGGLPRAATFRTTTHK